MKVMIATEQVLVLLAVMLMLGVTLVQKVKPALLAVPPLVITLTIPLVPVPTTTVMVLSLTTV